jgi:hypothetical protein
MRTLSEVVSNKASNRRDSLRNFAMAGAGALAVSILRSTLAAAPAFNPALGADAVLKACFDLGGSGV